MADGSGKAKKIDLGDDFGAVVVKVNGATIEVGPSGRVLVRSPYEVDIRYGASADKQEFSTTPRIGDLDDGGIYVGKSAEDGKPLHAALADLPDYQAYEALAAAEQLKAAHPTAHVPTPKELDKNLFDNRFTGHLKGTFNTSGSYPGSLYRSSASVDDFDTRVKWFGDGYQRYYGDRDDRLSVRLVW